MSKGSKAQTRGIVLRRASSGEGSVRVYLYTEALGLVSVIAKSAREERSKLRPHLQVGTYGSYDLVRGSGDWRAVGAVDTRSSYFSFSNNESAKQSAARVLSVLRQLVHGEDPDRELFTIVWRFLEALHTLPEEHIKHIERFAVFSMLSSLGYISTKHPELKTFDCSEQAAAALLSLEGEMVRAIREGFSASGLL